MIDWTISKDALQIIASMTYGDPTCEASVTRDWELDACGKPATTVVRVPWEGEMITYSTCTYHAHMLGAGAALPLAEILRAVSDD